MHLHIRFYPPLAIFFTGCLFSLLIFAAILVPSGVQNANNFTNTYGQSLATQAARQAVDATFNHDLVRLQVILQDVTENPYAVIATIHDVENKLLVQAGNARVDRSPTRTFTSPIILHDSIAGHVSVTLTTKPWSFSSLMGLLGACAALFVSLSAWSLFRSNALVWRRKTKPNSDPTQPSDEVATPPAYHQDDNEELHAVIYIKNLDILKQQLNGHNFREVISRLKSIISDVTALYGSHNYDSVGNTYVLRFTYHENDRGEALFNATCSAYLILELAGIINNIPLDLAALVSTQEEALTAEKPQVSGLILEASASAEPLISRRLKFMDLGTQDNKHIVAGFNQPFHTLLDNQRKQLSQIV